MNPKRRAPRPDVDVELVSALHSVVTKLSRAQRMEAMRAAGMPYSHMTLLTALERNVKMTPTELALAEGVKIPVMTRALAVVVGRGFVVRENHPLDGRQVILQISDTGREALEHARNAINDWYLMKISGLDDSSRRALRQSVLVLAQIVNQLGEYESPASRPKKP